MKVRDEIARYALPEDKEKLLFMFTKYHQASEWSFLAKCKFEGKYPKIARIWSLTKEGEILYQYFISHPERKEKEEKEKYV